MQNHAGTASIEIIVPPTVWSQKPSTKEIDLAMLSADMSFWTSVMIKYPSTEDACGLPVPCRASFNLSFTILQQARQKLGLPETPL